MFYTSSLSESLVLILFILNNFYDLPKAKAIGWPSLSNGGAQEETFASSHINTPDENMDSSLNAGPVKDVPEASFNVGPQKDSCELAISNIDSSESSGGLVASNVGPSIDAAPDVGPLSDVPPNVGSSIDLTPNVGPPVDGPCVQCSEPLKSCTQYTEELGEAEHRVAVQNPMTYQPEGPCRYRRSLDSPQDSPRMRISSKIMRLNRIIDDARKQDKNVPDEESNLVPIKMKDVNRLSLSHVRSKERKDHGEYKIKDMVSETLSPDINIDAIKGSVTNLKEEAVNSETDSKAINTSKKLGMKKEDETSEHFVKEVTKDGKSKEKTKDKKSKKSKERKLSKVFEKHKGKHKVKLALSLKPKESKEMVNFKTNNERMDGEFENEVSDMNGKESLDDLENSYIEDSDNQANDYVNADEGDMKPNDAHVSYMQNRESGDTRRMSLDETNEDFDNNESDGIKEYDTVDTQHDQAYDRAYEDVDIHGGSPDETALTESEATNSGEKNPGQSSGNSAQVKSLSHKMKPYNCDCKPPTCPTKCTTPCTTKCTTPCTTKCTTPCTTKCTTPCTTKCTPRCTTPCTTKCTTPCTTKCTTKCTTPCTTKCTTPCTTPKCCPTTTKSLLCCPARVYICSNPATTTTPAPCPMCGEAELSDGTDSDPEKKAVGEYKPTDSRDGVVPSPSQDIEHAGDAEDMKLSSPLAMSAEQDSSISQLSREMHGINNRLERIIRIIRVQKKSHGDMTASNQIPQQGDTADEKVEEVGGEGKEPDKSGMETVSDENGELVKITSASKGDQRKIVEHKKVTNIGRDEGNAKDASADDVQYEALGDVNDAEDNIGMGARMRSNPRKFGASEEAFRKSDENYDQR